MTYGFLHISGKNYRTDFKCPRYQIYICDDTKDSNKVIDDKKFESSYQMRLWLCLYGLEIDYTTLKRIITTSDDKIYSFSRVNIKYI